MKCEVNEVEEVKEAKGKKTAGAAFFDIDGTLLAKPSLERRFFWELQRCGKIPVRNYFAWLAETVRLGLGNPRDLRAIAQTNKSYLHGVRADTLSNANPLYATSSNVTSHAADHGYALPGGWLPEFFPAAIQRVWWHALRGDAIVLVSGTLAPLAKIVQFALERELLRRGVECNIFSIATQMEIADGCWTGSVAGAAIFGEEKAFAVKEFARARNISLERCSAYGDSSVDRWMLGAVGHAFAVNPAWPLRRIARSSGWPLLHWARSAVRGASEHRSAGELGAINEQRAAFEKQGLKKSSKLKREAAR